MGIRESVHLTWSSRTWWRLPTISHRPSIVLQEMRVCKCPGQRLFGSLTDSSRKEVNTFLKCDNMQLLTLLAESNPPGLMGDCIATDSGLPPLELRATLWDNVSPLTDYLIFSSENLPLTPFPCWGSLSALESLPIISFVRTLKKSAAIKSATWFLTNVVR